MRLSTARLGLREFEPADLRVMRAWQGDPRYLEHYPAHYASGQNTGELIALFIRWQTEQPRWHWQFAVETSGSGLLIGSAGVRRADVAASTGDIGFELDPNQWGHGYATEAATRTVTFAFEQIGLLEVTARVVQANERSIRVLDRLGFSRALELKAGLGRDGRVWPDQWEYRLNSSDWDHHSP